MSRAIAPVEYSIEPYDLGSARALRETLGISDPVAVTLVRRGFDTVEAARDFLAAEERHDPFEFDSMEEVVATILEAIERGTRITVHGDYDVDGVCSTSILIKALRDLGADCDWYLPSRLEEGYGLTTRGVERVAQRGTGLLVTVDCGIGSVEEVNEARELGMQVIVTDHHQPGDALPECPILHPRLCGYPCPDLCATAVAGKLAEALRSRGRTAASDAAGDADLMALATVADLVSLQGENRSIVRAGLAEARSARRPGLRALMAVAGVEPERLDEGDLSFRLAPRINAAGRLGRADAGVELMLTSDAQRAEGIARELEAANRERRAVETDALRAAETAARQLPGGIEAHAGLVVAGEGWHPGVVGIVASRLVEAHWRPTIVIGLDPDGHGRGSARSIPGFDLLEGLRACDEHLLRYGGHSAAAGLEIEAARLDGFREAFNRHVESALDGEKPVRTERVDAVVGAESLGISVAEELERLGPFGMGNPEVRLLVPSARVRDVRPMGEGDKHARFSLQSGPKRALGVAFGVNGELVGAGEGPHDLTLRLELNQWNGAVEPRVVLGSVYPVDPPAESTEFECTSPADSHEWWGRFEAELLAPLGAPVGAPSIDARREVVDRRGSSPVASLAALVSAGVPVLAVCADALRRRALVQRTVAPERFGGGAAAIACGHCSATALRELPQLVLERGRGLVLTDWAALQREPGLPAGFEHVVVVDPPPFPHLEEAATGGAGYTHICWATGEIELALQLNELDWAPRNALGALFAKLREHGPAEGEQLRALLAGRGALPLTPEQAARRCRVLIQLGLVSWEGRGATRTLGVVSSVQTDLERSVAYRAYRERCEEGRQFLSSRKAQT